MTIGSTSGKEPDHIPDEDLRTLDQLRGDMKDINDARMSLREKGTVEGLRTQVEVLKQQLETTHEQMQSLINIYGTLQEEFKQYREQRVIELQSWLAKGGSTTPEDNE